jgi:hypothetical protein
LYLAFARLLIRLGYFRLVSRTPVREGGGL